MRVALVVAVPHLLVARHTYSPESRGNVQSRSSTIKPKSSRKCTLRHLAESQIFGFMLTILISRIVD